MSRRSERRMARWVQRHGDDRAKQVLASREELRRRAGFRHPSGGGLKFGTDLFVAVDFHCRKHRHRLLRAGMDTAPTLHKGPDNACVCPPGATEPCPAHEFWWTDMRPISVQEICDQYGRTQGVGAKTKIVCSEGCHVQVNSAKARDAVRGIWQLHRTCVVPVYL